MYISSEVEKSDTNLHDIHPGPFDSYVHMDVFIFLKILFHQEIPGYGWNLFINYYWGY